MKIHKLFWFIVVLTVWFQAEAPAQFYAPATEFHDRCQRLFPVEAARMLAWRENIGHTNIAEVTYDVSVNASRVTSWNLNCLDAAGHLLKHIQVSYPETLLLEGPKFYREVFGQIWAQGKWRSAANLSVTDLNKLFWTGADRNGASREYGLHSAFQLAGSATAQNWDKDLAPMLAGLLTHTAMPVLAGGVTLDSVLLARGAAWLAFSERMLPGSTTAADANWAPTLFMAGRENAACKLWKTHPTIEGGTHAILYSWWNFFLQKPKARQAFEFVTDPAQKKFAMPLIAYYSHLLQLHGPVGEVLRMLYGDDVKTIGAIYDYGAFISQNTGIGGGRILEGLWPALFRMEWARTLKALPISMLDYQGYQTELKMLPAQFAKPMEDERSLYDLPEMTPLLELGYEQGTGKLIPTAVVTARDFLNYGWEMNGLEMGTRYYFVNNMWAIPDTGEMIFHQATKDIQGQAPFFPNTRQKRVFSLKDSMQRLQMVDDLGWRVGDAVQPFSDDLQDAAAGREFYQRCWLRPYDVRFQGHLLAVAKSDDELLKVLQRYHDESGRLSDEITVEFLEAWDRNHHGLATHPELEQFKQQLAQGLPEPTKLKLTAVDRPPMINSLKGQMYEKAFWENPDSGLQFATLNNYLDGGAWKSAARFYLQMRKMHTDDMELSNDESPRAWWLGFLLGSQELMDAAVEDTQTGSRTAMTTVIWDDFAQNKITNAMNQLDELHERYETGAGTNCYTRIVELFVPLLPALRDPHNPDHAAALDYFGKSDTAVMLRWMWIQKYRLGKDEAIRFLGGKETDRLRRMMILYLEHDTAQLKAAWKDLLVSNEQGAAARMVATWMEVHTLNVPVGIEETDLKPVGAKSIVQAVAERLHIKLDR